MENLQDFSPTQPDEHHIGRMHDDLAAQAREERKEWDEDKVDEPEGEDLFDDIEQ